MSEDRRVFTPWEIAWVNEAGSEDERERRICELKARYSGEAIDPAHERRLRLLKEARAH